MCDVDNGIKYCLVNGEYIVGTGNNNFNNADSGINSFRLIIPRKVNGHKVEAIGKYAFAQNRKIIEAIIYARVSYIDDWAFCRCINLATINIPSSCTRLGYVALDQYDEQLKRYSKGSITIFFEKNSKIKTFDEKAIGFKDVINIYFCEKVSISFTSSIQFENSPNLNIYSPQSFSLKGHQSKTTNFCYSLPTLFLKETKYEKLFPFHLIQHLIFIIL